MVPASKRYTIHRSSKVLIMSLKRFADFSGGKISKHVNYPEYLDLRAYMSQSTGEPLIYSLYAVLVHSGFSCNAGHYICFIKAGNGFWYRMNDAIVERSDIKTVLNQQAYLLFYIRRYDLTLGECGLSLPAPSYARSFLGQRGPKSKQAGFTGPRLPPHMVKKSSCLNGNGPLKGDTNPVGMTINKPSSAPPTACIRNVEMTRPSSTDPSKAQKITISIPNKLPELQTVSQPGCVTSALENEDLSKAVPSSTITDSLRAESSSNASTVAVAANISKQEVPDEMFVEPAVNIPVAESPIPQEIILESLACNHLNRLSEKTRMRASQYRPSHNERNSPNNGKSWGKYSDYRSRSRERTEQDRNKYYRSKGEKTWSPETYCQDEAQRWEKCRYYEDYDSARRTGNGRERKYTHSDKDFDKRSQFSKSERDDPCKSRWADNTHCREEGAHHLSSHRGNLRHCSVPPQQSEKHSWEGHAPPPASARAQFDNAFWENKKLRLGKRKYSDTEGGESEVERKRRKIDDKYQETDYRYKAH